LYSLLFIDLQIVALFGTLANDSLFDM